MVRGSEAPERWDLEVDWVCAGSSSGGLLAAIVARDLGLSAAVLEKAKGFGGGTAYSAGAIWIPNNELMKELGLADSKEEALTFLRRISQGRHDEAMANAYIDRGPEMVRYLHDHTPLRMVVDHFPGYYGDLPGGKPDGRRLSPDAEPMMAFLQEAQERHPLLEKVRHDPVPYYLGRRDPWAEGRGLIGMLLACCLDRGVEVFESAPAQQLVVEDGRVTGLRAQRDGRDFFVRGRRGVLLATGGFEWNAEMNKRYINSPDMHGCTAPSNEGDGHVMGMEIGAATALMDHSIFQSTIRVTGEECDGQPFYRLISFGYPGNILVNGRGERCCDESVYPALGWASMAHDRTDASAPNLPLWWICDQGFRERFGVGALSHKQESADWLFRADRLDELAEMIGIPPDRFVANVDRFNANAREGRDPDFQRGERLLGRYWAEAECPDHEPNPALGPVEKPPFYAVQLHQGTMGNLGGLVTNPDAQVIDVRGEVIPGLYATSNAAALLSHGFGYESGTAVGRSMIFGYQAARHAARA
ncbi:MAG: FAD-binding protein [Deltaproteobacteria bacterium]|nr:FAD-binding protein [Deltaproteobacteria bacterium]MBW2419574.1 FAD-binding protein [Deltaproteobacteria bacterium]